MDRYEEEFAEKNTAPKFLFQHQGIKKEVTAAEVTGIRYWPRPGLFERDKPTEEEIADAKALLEKLTADGCLDTKWLYVGQKSGSTSWSTPWAEIGANPLGGMHWTKEQAEAASLAWNEKYAPREGHFNCGQCGVITPNEKAVKFAILIHGGRKVERSFCSGECAGNNQFAQEG